MMLIVDAHIHLWQGLSAPQHHRREPYLAEQAIYEMDAAGVERSVNCPAIWDDRANDYALEAACAYPDRLATMGWFPLDRTADAAYLERFLGRPGTLGLRFVIARAQDCAALEAGGLDWIWSVADRLGRPVSFGIAKPLLATVEGIARRFPRARFLIDHLGVGPFEKLPAAMDHIEDLIRLALLPNVAVKATATPSMSNDAYPFPDVSTYLRRLFDAYGPDRMFWGTDFTRMRISLRECVAQFTEHLPWLKGQDLDRVMGEALCEWLQWPLPARS